MKHLLEFVEIPTNICWNPISALCWNPNPICWNPNVGILFVGIQIQSLQQTIQQTGQHLLESNQCARNYPDLQFKILTTACSQFHLSLLEAVYISRKKPDLCRQKQLVFTVQLFR